MSSNMNQQGRRTPWPAGRRPRVLVTQAVPQPGFKLGDGDSHSQAIENQNLGPQQAMPAGAARSLNMNGSTGSQQSKFPEAGT